jgi:hypothetical protein
VNTPQLIVIWYAGLLIATVLVFNGGHNDSGYNLIAAIIIIAGMLIYTLKPHPKARKKLALAWVLAPLIIGPLVVYGWFQYDQYRQIEPVSQNERSLSDAEFQRFKEQYQGGKLLDEIREYESKKDRTSSR